MPQNFLPLIDQYENFYYEKNKVTKFLRGIGSLSTGLDYLKFANLLLNDGKLKNKRIFAKEVMNRIRTNSIDGDIASNGVRSFAQMPTVGMGHSLAGSVIIDPNESFVRVMLVILGGEEWLVIIFGLILRKIIRLFL